ncbi:hypothetical protein BUE76_04060 [Cnuella takakiae]|nr:hypothetical protein BUE76_04060 [Cnuella takakiae]
MWVLPAACYTIRQPAGKGPGSNKYLKGAVIGAAQKGSINFCTPFLLIFAIVRKTLWVALLISNCAEKGF